MTYMFKKYTVHTWYMYNEKDDDWFYAYILRQDYSCTFKVPSTRSHYTYNYHVDLSNANRIGSFLFDQMIIRSRQSTMSGMNASGLRTAYTSKSFPINPTIDSRCPMLTKRLCGVTGTTWPSTKVPPNCRGMPVAPPLYTSAPSFNPPWALW